MHSLDTHSFFFFLIRTCILCCSSTDTTLLCHINGCVKDGMYIYSPHLMALDSCKPVQDEPRHGESPDHHFPLKVELWAKKLHSHPDNYFTSYVLEGLTNGFRIGFNHRHLLCSSIRNLSTKNPDVITSYLKREVQDEQTYCSPSRYKSHWGNT